MPGSLALSSSSIGSPDRFSRRPRVMSGAVYPGTAARIDLVRAVALDRVPLHVIGQQRFIIGGERRRNGLFKCGTLARHQVDPNSFSKRKQVAPRVAVAFGKLIGQLLDAGRGLGDDLLLFSLPQRYLCIERTFEQSLEVECN
jgi:hypothetical protein